MNMDYENHIEIYEAVYFFNRIACLVGENMPLQLSKQDIDRLGITQSVYKAAVRILAVNNLLDYDETRFVLETKATEKHRHILERIIDKNPHYIEMFNKALNPSQFFFDCLSSSEYEVYSRYNFRITYNTGKKVVEHINLSGKKILEIGGNSGGLGAAILMENKDCTYTVVDTSIPCKVGEEFNKSKGLDI